VSDYNNFWHRLSNSYAKNYCNLTLIVKSIVENVVTCFLWTLYFRGTEHDANQGNINHIVVQNY